VEATERSRRGSIDATAPEGHDLARSYAHVAPNQARRFREILSSRADGVA
jgi:hypothetical protein